MSRLAIVGIFYDGYYDLWEDFLDLLSSNWDSCPYDIYIVNNEKELDFSIGHKVTVLHAGEDAEYSKKVQLALESIEADYYLLLLEDFLIQKRIQLDPLPKILDYMESNGVSYYRMQMPDFIRNGSKSLEPQVIDCASEYTVTCQPSIWKKDFLERCIGKRNYNAWVFEGIYCFSKDAHKKEFLEKCRVDYNNPLGLRHLAIQGKLLPNVYEDFVENGYRFKTQRKMLDKKTCNKIKVKQFIKRRSPAFIQKLCKSLFSGDSIVEKYKDDIAAEMNYLNIE